MTGNLPSAATGTATCRSRWRPGTSRRAGGAAAEPAAQAGGEPRLGDCVTQAAAACRPRRRRHQYRDRMIRYSPRSLAPILGSLARPRDGVLNSARGARVRGLRSCIKVHASACVRVRARLRVRVRWRARRACCARARARARRTHTRRMRAAGVEQVEDGALAGRRLYTTIMYSI